jgi:hypothetical protein
MGARFYMLDVGTNLKDFANTFVSYDSTFWGNDGWR